MNTLRFNTIRLHNRDSESQFTYWADLESTKLNDTVDTVPTQWVHALPLGSYKHPIHGMLDFTPERIQRFAQSVRDKVRGIDPDIDYDHKLDPSKGKAAAGWVKDADARSDGLWLFVEWTKDAAEALKNKQYRYFSAEFADKLEDNQGNVLQDVVLGGGLTNRPFMKNLTPINLSEVVGNETTQEDVMDRAELARILGLSEDADEGAIKAKVSELSERKKGDSTKFSVKEEDGKLVIEHPDVEGSFTHDLPQPKVEDKNKEGEQELAKLAEDNPAIKLILEQNKQLSEDVKTMQAATRLSEVTTQLSEVGKDAGVVLPPVVQTKLRTVMAQLPTQLSDSIADAMKELVKVGGPVQLGEQVSGGKAKDGRQGGEDVVNKFLSEVDAAMEKDDKLEYRYAVDQVKRTHPQLWEGYEEARANGISLVEEG
jgi:hypothetical protein